MMPILVAGIGNIFNGDDAFGVEVVGALSQRPLPREVEVIDFGIRGIDLTYALLENYSAAVLVDAAQRGEYPGTISVVDLSEMACAPPSGDDLMLSPHELEPAKVIRLVSALGGTCRQIFLVACEPLTFGGEEGLLGLSAPVATAVQIAVGTVEELIDQLIKAEAGKTRLPQPVELGARS
ncbi:MAG TPA: hydrogenase maturation protease [Methylocella sp.]|nr:hydrogenase maturation protease [Methylocella sp.]